MTTLVLIVDDNPINLRLAADVLEHEGFEVQRAMDAEEAQSLLGVMVPDLILMDIALPGMDGLTLTGILKSDQRYAGIPIVALTASAMSGDEARSRSAGCDGYISKPIDTRRFATQVRQYLRGAQFGSPGREDIGEV
jgi:CheY-like chemotaxis protein